MQNLIMQIIETSAHEDDPILVEKQPKRISRFTIILSIINLCAGSGVGYALPNAAAFTGPSFAFMVCILSAFLSWYSLDLLTKHLSPESFNLNDEILISRFPKTKPYVLLLTRGSSFILHGTYIVSNFLYIDYTLQSLAWDHHHIPRAWQIIVTLAIMTILSLVLSDSLSAKISAVGSLVPFVNLIAVLYFGIKKSSIADRQCLRDSFVHPYSYGLFSSSKKAGAKAIFQLFSQYYSSYYAHNSFPSLAVYAKKHHTLRKDAFTAVFVMMIYYALSAMIGQMPYACYGYTSSVYPPSDYISIFANSAFGDFISVFFLLGLIGNTPYAFTVTRVMVFQWVDWSGRRKLRYLCYIIFNCIILTIAALIDAFNVSIQTLLQVGGIFCACIWMSILPVFWEVYIARTRNFKIISITVAVAVGLTIMLTEFLQFKV